MTMGGGDDEETRDDDALLDTGIDDEPTAALLEIDGLGDKLELTVNDEDKIDDARCGDDDVDDNVDDELVTLADEPEIADKEDVDDIVSECDGSEAISALDIADQLFCNGMTPNANTNTTVMTSIHPMPGRR